MGQAASTNRTSCDWIYYNGTSCMPESSIENLLNSGADPGFEKGRGAAGSEASF